MNCVSDVDHRRTTRTFSDFRDMGLFKHRADDGELADQAFSQLLRRKSQRRQAHFRPSQICESEACVSSEPGRKHLSVLSLQSVNGGNSEVFACSTSLDNLAARENDEIVALEEPGPYDVVCGRNHAAYNHIGNRYVYFHRAVHTYF
jgi:hypothetical protein